MSKNIAHTIVAAIMLFSSSAMAADYVVDTKASTIAFSGTHIGKEFKGQFSDWTADVSFDPVNLAGSHIKAVLKAASAKTGDMMYDGTMPEDDWFKVKEFPEITFVSKTIKENTDKSYTATGDLTIRGITHSADLVFTVDLTQKPVVATGKLVVDRLTYDLGKKSDVKAEWVSKDIAIEINIKATAK